METLENILSQEIIRKLGWMLVHFVWEGTVIALIASIVLRMLRRYPANLRYITACVALALMVLTPAITIRMIETPVTIFGPMGTAMPELSTAITGSQATIETPQAEPSSTTAMEGISLKDRLTGVIESALPYTVVGWLAGVFGLSLWHLGGWAQLQRLRQRMVKDVSERVRLRLKRLAERMEVKRAVAIIESALVQVPTVVGHLKPIILLPASALTGLSSGQIKAILAHELAHIKRCDYLVNILQTVAEILGFYHPAVWWISHKIRVERENCCDDLAVSITGDKFHYARTLITLEEIRSEHVGLAVAASGGSLLDRICRLTSKGKRTPEKCSWAVPVLAILLMVSVLVLISCQGDQTIVSKGKGHWNSIIAELDIDNATSSSVKDVLGEPLQYVWEQQVLNKNALPYRYIMVYAGDFHVFVVNDRIIEVRFEGPSDYVFGDGLVVGSSIEDGLRILGRPSEVVDGKPNEFQDDVLYKNIGGEEGYCYYARPDKNIRIWILDNKVKAIYLTRSDYSAGWKRLKDSELPETSYINENGHIVDKVDYPFVNDPEVPGRWESVDFVREISAFNPKRKSWVGDLYLKELIFNDGGETSWGFSWTKGLVLSNDSAAKYLIKEIDGARYMFMEWKSGDYTIRHMKPFYYVLKKDPDDMVYVESRIVDKTDYPFVDDPEVIGTWESVDFVDEIEEFEAGEKEWAGGELFLKEMIFEDNGKATLKNESIPGGYSRTWTKGLVLNEKGQTASRYIIREISGSTYMFYEWKSGDYIFRRMKPAYYVLKK